MVGLTKDYFDQKLEGLEATIRGGTQDVISHFNKSQGNQNIRLDGMDRSFESIGSRLGTMDVKLDAIMEMLAMRKELSNLIRQLKKNGITLDESQIFVS